MIRPTPDRVREALFSILGALDGQRVLDLYSGTGALGLEALSRGAREAVLVDAAAESVALVRANLRSTGLEGSARVVRDELPDALDRLAGREEPFDLILLDPPYGRDEDDEMRTPTLTHPSLGRLLAPGATVVAEHPTRRPPPDCPGVLRRYDSRRYGSVSLSFFERSEDEA